MMEKTNTIYQTKLEPEKILVLLETFFKANGFKVELLDGDTMIAVKGSRWRNTITFNPLSWRSVHKLKIEDKQVRLESEVDDSFQMVTAAEKRVWSEFFREIEKILSTGKISDQLKLARRKNMKKNISFFSYILVGMALGGLLAGGVTWLNSGLDFLIEPIFFLGAISGIWLYFIHERKKSNSAFIKGLVDAELKNKNRKM